MSKNSLQVFTDYLKSPAELLQDMEKPLENNSSFKAQWINEAVSSFSLRKINIPHGKLLTLYRKIVGVIAWGYEQKELDRTTVVRLLTHLIEKGRAKNKVLFSVNSYDTTLPSILVSGISGSGKTKTIRTAFSYIPQVIFHYDPENGELIHKQIVWLSFNCSPTMSMFGFALNFFKAVDGILDTDYLSQWLKKSNPRVDHCIISMQKIALIHSIGIIHVDELQFLIQKNSNKEPASISKVEAIFNEIKVPMILSCTAQGVEWLKNNEALLEHQEITLIRRLCSDEHFEFHQIHSESTFYCQFIKKFFENNLLANGVKSPDDFKTLFLELTAGLIAAMTRLACLYIEAIQVRKRSDLYDNAELCRVFKSNFKLWEPALEALRKKRFQDFEAEYIIAKKQSVKVDKENHKIEPPKVIQSRVQHPSEVKHLQELNVLAKDVGVNFDEI
jgi:hypothetical protein